jgi:hypothetical protein
MSAFASSSTGAIRELINHFRGIAVQFRRAMERFEAKATSSPRSLAAFAAVFATSFAQSSSCGQIRRAGSPPRAP